MNSLRFCSEREYKFVRSKLRTALRYIESEFKKNEDPTKTVQLERSDLESIWRNIKDADDCLNYIPSQRISPTRKE